MPSQTWSAGTDPPEADPAAGFSSLPAAIRREQRGGPYARRHPGRATFEYVDAPNLAEVIAGGVPRLSAALGILSGVAEALVAIHGVGLVHPDLEPGNVLVAPSGWWSSTSGSPPR